MVSVMLSTPGDAAWKDDFINSEMEVVPRVGEVLDVEINIGCADEYVGVSGRYMVVEVSHEFIVGRDRQDSPIYIELKRQGTLWAAEDQEGGDAE